MTNTLHKERFIETVGRRKTASARVRISPAKNTLIMVDEKDVTEYFPTKELQKIVNEALDFAPEGEKFIVTAKIKGGGIHSQAEALRLGISRGLIKHNLELRPELKKAGFLKRDPRKKERKKFGLKKARKSPQWSKR